MTPRYVVKVDGWYSMGMGPDMTKNQAEAWVSHVPLGPWSAKEWAQHHAEYLKSVYHNRNVRVVRLVKRYNCDAEKNRGALSI